MDEEENAARAKAASDVATVEVTEEVHEWASLLKDFFLTLNRDGFATFVFCGGWRRVFCLVLLCACFDRLAATKAVTDIGPPLISPRRSLRPLLQLLINYRRDLMVLMGSDVEDDELTALKRRIIGKVSQRRALSCA